MTFSLSFGEISTLVISSFSFWVAFKAYSHSIPKLLLNMYVAGLYDIRTKAHSKIKFINISIVNASIRPITVTNIGGHYDHRIVRRFKMIVGKLVVPASSFIWAEPAKLFFGEDGKPRILKDGESISDKITLSNEITSVQEYRHNIDKIKSIWVSDAAGREYYLNRNALKKLKADLKSIPSKAN